MTPREACERAQTERLQLPWMPLDADYLSNGKTLHLEGLLKDERAPLYVLRVIQWAWHNRQGGRFRSAEAAVVLERVAGWKGADGVLFAALLEARWVDQDAEGVLIHGWEERAGKQFQKTFADRDRKKNPPEEQEENSAPRKLHGGSAETPPHRSRSRRKKQEEVFSGAPDDTEQNLDSNPPPPTPSGGEEEGFEKPGDKVWKQLQRSKLDNGYPQDLHRPDRWDLWAQKAAERYGLENLCWAAVWFVDDEAFERSGWAPSVLMSKEVYPQRCHPPRPKKQSYF